MWLIKSKDAEGKERLLIANGANARPICEALVSHGLPVKTYRVNTYRDFETMRLFCLDEFGSRLWIRSEEDLLMKGYSELLTESEFREAMNNENKRGSGAVVSIDAEMRDGVAS